MAGVNKACTYVNVPPWIREDADAQRRFSVFPWDLLKGDVVGFTAITDPCWPRLEPQLREFLERAGTAAKMVTLVTKWPLSRRQVRFLSDVPNLFLVISITGNPPPIEGVPVSKHLETLERCKDAGIPSLPIVHPYISGVSDLGFLPNLIELGYDQVGVKGIRYCDAHMASWMPSLSRGAYRGREDEEVLPEDGWRQLVEDAGFTLRSPKDWYLEQVSTLGPHLERGEAENLVDQVFRLANVTSSSDDASVWEAAIRRRM